MVRLTRATARRLAGAAVALLLAACGPAPRPADAPPPDHRAAVWAPSWGADAGLALGKDRLEPRVARLLVFVGHVGVAPEPERFPVDWAAVAASGRPVELAVLVGRSAYGAAGQVRLAAAADLVAAALADARAAEVRVEGVHLETECPPGRLAALALALESFRPRFGGLRLGVSMLPSQLREDGADRLAAAIDGLTVNVMRGMILGGSPDIPGDDALEAAFADIAALGRPTRLGVPISAHYACLDESGAEIARVLVGIRPPAGTARVRVLSPDPEAVAALVRRVASHAPANLSGIDWFRLPIPGDAGVWSADGLRAALDGRSPPRGLEVVLETTEDEGLRRVVLVNAGAIPLAPAEVLVSWDKASPLACDGLGGHELLAPAPGGFRLRPLPGSSVVGPGESRLIGWVRFDETPRDFQARLAGR